MEPLIRDLSIQYEKPDVGVTHRSLLGLLGGLVQVFHIFMEFNFHTANIGYSTFYGHGGYTGFRETLQTILVSFARYLVSIDGSDMNDSGDRMLVRRIMLLSTALYEQLEWHPYTPHFGVSERFTGRGRYSKHCDGIRDRLSSMWHAQEIPPNFESFCNAVDGEAPALMYMWSKEGLRRGPGNLFCPIELSPRKITAPSAPQPPGVLHPQPCTSPPPDALSHTRWKCLAPLLTRSLTRSARSPTTSAPLIRRGSPTSLAPLAAMRLRFHRDSTETCEVVTKQVVRRMSRVPSGGSLGGRHSKGAGGGAGGGARGGTRGGAGGRGGGERGPGGRGGGGSGSVGGDGFPDSLMLAVELIDGDEGMIRVSKRVTWRLCIFPLVYAPDAEAKFHSVTLVHDPSSMNRTFLFDGAKIHGVDGLESMKEMFRKSKVRDMNTTKRYVYEGIPLC